jgi:outer membrane protein
MDGAMTCRLLAVFAGATAILSGCQTAPPWEMDSVQLADRLGRTELQDDSPVPRGLMVGTAGGHEWDLEDADDPDGPLEMSRERAVFTALRNNRSLSVQQLTPVIVGTFEELERAVYDPRVYAEGAYARARGEQITPAIAQPFELQTEGHSVEAGIAQRLTTGTEISGSLSHGRQTTDLTPGRHTVRAGLTLTQALLQGGSREANLAQVRQARIDRDISIYELRGFVEAMVAQVESVYWQFVLAEQQIRIFQQSLDLARRQQEETEQRFEAGVMPRTELPAVRAEVARREQGLIDARSSRDQLRVELLRLMNPETAQQWDREINAEAPRVPEVPLDEVADLIQLALSWRPELHEARLRLDRGQLEVVRTRNGLLPRLDLFVTLGKSGFAGSFGDAVEDLDGRGYDFTAGLRLDYPIGNRGPRAAHRAALTGRHQAALSIENLAQLVEADVRRAYLEVLRTREQISATAVTRELQEEVLRAENERLGAGVSTALLVAQAQRDLLAAQIDEVQALVQHQQSLIDLYRLSGSLLLRRGIAAPGEKQQSGSLRAQEP